jgi:hypothetical protein
MLRRPNQFANGPSQSRRIQSRSCLAAVLAAGTLRTFAPRWHCRMSNQNRRCSLLSSRMFPAKIRSGIVGAWESAEDILSIPEYVAVIIKAWACCDMTEHMPRNLMT